MEKDIYLEISDLKKYFKLGGRRILKAVDGVNLSVSRGEVIGLVGESGCGKSTLGKLVAGIYKPTSGSVKYEGVEVSELRKRDRRGIATKVQMIFQDPYASLNPRVNAGNIVAEGLKIQNKLRGKDLTERVGELLELVGLGRDQMNRYPHEFSGGQRQRIGIARALALNPEFLICDEPISALDVSVQAQIVGLMRRLKNELSLTYLFIAHDLNMVRYLSDRIAVMYLGHIMEVGESDEVYSHSAHPYTKALIESVPVADPALQKGRELPEITGELPSPINPPSGCIYRTRCPLATPRCAEEMPKLKDLGGGHMAACHCL